MQLTTSRQLTLGGATYSAGSTFECDDKTAEDLLARLPHIRPARPPMIFYETKPAKFEIPQLMPQAGEVKPAGDPFRNGAVSNPQPPRVASEGDPVLAGANVPEQGTANRGGRGGRSRFGSRR